MPNDNKSASGGTPTSIDPGSTPADPLEDRLYDLVDRCHVGTRRMINEPFVEFADRVITDLNASIAFLSHEIDDVNLLIDEHFRPTGKLSDA